MNLKGLLIGLGISATGISELDRAHSNWIINSHNECVYNSPPIKNIDYVERIQESAREEMGVSESTNIEWILDSFYGRGFSRYFFDNSEYVATLGRNSRECSIIHELCHIKYEHHKRNHKWLNLAEEYAPWSKSFLEGILHRINETEAIRCQEEYYERQRKAVKRDYSSD